MDLFKGNQGKGEAGFTLIELLVVIGILAVLAAVAIPAYSRFFGEGEIEANSAELSNIQAAMDAYMAHHRILFIDAEGDAGADPPIGGVDDFSALPEILGLQPVFDPDGLGPLPAVADPVYPNFLRIGNSTNPTKMCYAWTETGFMSQVDRDPLSGRCK